MGITLFGSYKSALKKYAEFNGRLSRKGFWYFVLAHLLVGLFVYIIGNLIVPNPTSEPYSYENPNFLYNIYVLAMIIPSISTSVRRLHDINKSGWNYLLQFIPIVGFIIILIYYFRKGDQVDNAYGPVPSE